MNVNKQHSIINHNILTPSERNYFKDLFKEYRDSGSNLLSYENFKEIVYMSKRIKRQPLNDQLNAIKKVLEQKKEYSNKPIAFNEAEYIRYIEEIITEQDLFANTKDPEMESLFELLCQKDTESIPLKKLQDIISIFDLPVNIKEFFAPIGNKQQLEFADFCSLFRAYNKYDEEIFKTFYSTFVGGNENNTFMVQGNKMFPIKYVPH